MNAPRLSACLCLSMLAVAAASPAFGLANRVFVSARTGNNANSCDNIGTPCQTLQGAINQLNPAGEAIVLDSGGYGPVTITKSVTIDAAPGVLAFIHPPAGNAITVAAGTLDSVTLRGLTLNGNGVPSADGIIVTSVGSLHIESCVIGEFDGYGLEVNAPNGSVFVKDTIVRHNASGGMIFNGGRGSVDHCRVESNGYTGIYVSAADVTVQDSVTIGNTHGLIAFDGILNVYRCTSANNAADGVRSAHGVSGFCIVRVGDSCISENIGFGFDAGAGSTFESLGNNFVRGNVGGAVSGSVTTVPLL